MSSSEENPDALLAKLRDLITKRSALKKKGLPNTKGPQCIKKWVEVPTEKIESYDMAQITKCGTCRSRRNAIIYAVPYVVHDTLGDYICFKCGESCNIKYMCPQCSGSLNQQLRRNNRDARLY